MVQEFTNELIGDFVALPFHQRKDNQPYQSKRSTATKEQSYRGPGMDVPRGGATLGTLSRLVLPAPYGNCARFLCAFWPVIKDRQMRSLTKQHVNSVLWLLSQFACLIEP